MTTEAEFDSAFWGSPEYTSIKGLADKLEKQLGGSIIAKRGDKEKVCDEFSESW